MTVLDFDSARLPLGLGLVEIATHKVRFDPEVEAYCTVRTNVLDFAAISSFEVDQNEHIWSDQNIFFF